MSGTRPSPISRFLAFSVGAVWYLIIVLIVLAVAFWIAVMLGWNPTRGKLEIALPIKVEYKAAAEAASSSAGETVSPLTIVGHTDVVFREAISKSEVSFFVLLIALPFLFVFLLIARQLRLFLRSVKEGRPFERENPKRIRLIGYLVLVLGFLEFICDLVVGLIYVHKISLPGAELSVHPGWQLDNIFLGLLILLIAQIFDAGVKMQEEQDLTV